MLQRQGLALVPASQSTILASNLTSAQIMSSIAPTGETVAKTLKMMSLIDKGKEEVTEKGEQEKEKK